MSAPTSLPMSPNQVAHRTGTSRRTVMRAIDTQELKAFRDNRNHWKITVQALEEWANAQCAPSGQMPTPAHLDQTETAGRASPDLEAERAARQLAEDARRVAEIEAAELRGKLAATEAERDRLHGIVVSLTEGDSRRRSWWPWRR